MKACWWRFSPKSWSSALLLFAPFFAGLNLGSTNLQFGNLPRELGGIIISFIILFNAMEDFLRSQFANLLEQTPFDPAGA